jgi:hypothetical protein
MSILVISYGMAVKSVHFTGIGGTAMSSAANPASMGTFSWSSDSLEIKLYKMAGLCEAETMICKKFLLALPALLLTGCAATFTRLTPLEQPRNPNNLYPVEVSFHSSQQSLRWDSLKPYVLVNGELYPLRPVQMVQNRWEGFVPVPAGTNAAGFRFKFDYLYNNFDSPPKPNSAWSPEYQLRIIDQ